ncbi:hypothetical protein PTSG_00595 [Salpingoeca rosetta]|uniref:Tyrosine specific protein phosphatases domain-containing protein n=1 Tax=Salpingoeca rosetta (strain ATCC 50818 / BSB-021) TaxID=946362 RepID=F2TWX6_SALR5|nr:uncharacterized protein PTSG_00595 [Salpingoeca rosetta]EGD75885.1 hypothetical protein PTSG_00595 [Salpingoeca rosetta]|eukprot:XP_004998061.1 hypothetical protein PTSG_00595 [Salpingoeca rosetta]
MSSVASPSTADGSTAAESELLTLKRAADEAIQRLTASHTQQIQVRGKQLRVLHLAVDDPSSPVLFFVHGFGGRLEQWEQQFSFFYKRANVVAVDLIGHGGSAVVDEVEAYSTPSIVDDLKVIFDQYRCRDGRFNVLIGHSYGASLICKLWAASEAVRSSTCGVVFCGSTLAGIGQELPLKVMGCLPCMALDAVRCLMNWGGASSWAVQQFVGPQADDDIRRKQYNVNCSTATSVLINTARGLSLATPDEYAALDCPAMLLVGSEDKVTPPQTTHRIYTQLQRPHGPYEIPGAGHNLLAEAAQLVNALLNKFLISKCNLASLTVEADTDTNIDQSKPKWALKNHAKWKATPPASAVIGRRRGCCGGFRACKVLRQDDVDHSPAHFKDAYPNVGLIIDISKETPPYLPPSGAHPEYIKVPTESKVIPADDRVQAFIETADDFWRAHPGQEIAVHCHYGYNRTGYVICCYLIERLGFTPAQALAEFATSRPPGIKHPHFRHSLVAKYNGAL